MLTCPRIDGMLDCWASAGTQAAIMAIQMRAMLRRLIEMGSLFPQILPANCCRPQELPGRRASRSPATDPWPARWERAQSRFCDFPIDTIPGTSTAAHETV